MSESTPTTDDVESAYASEWDSYHGYQWSAELASGFRRWLTSVERAAAEKALNHIRSEIQGIPHWWNSELNYGEFDLQPLGPNETSEKGAYMEVMRVLDECAAAYRREDTE